MSHEMNVPWGGPSFLLLRKLENRLTRLYPKSLNCVFVNQPERHEGKRYLLRDVFARSWIEQVFRSVDFPVLTFHAGGRDSMQRGRTALTHQLVYFCAYGFICG